MHRCGRFWTPLLFLAACCAASSAFAQQTQNLAGRWPMERVSLNDGRSYFGLILSVGDEALEMLEIRRPQGKPMFGVILPIERESITSIQRLPEAQRHELRRRFERFKNRLQFEARRVESIDLVLLREGERNVARYKGGWFEMQSLAGVQTTRLLIVRLEQMLLAFKQLLPPRNAPEASNLLKVRVYGTREAYARFLRREQIPIRNPAYYSAEDHVVVAGSDVRRYFEELKAAAENHRELQRELEQQRQRLPLYLEELKQEFLAAGKLPENWNQIRVAAYRRLEQEEKLLALRIKSAERRNERLVDGELARMLARLYHELFHAYLEAYVYPCGQHDVPVWLNEGLAQIFEHGQLEAGTLRIDAPPPDKLARLQADLAGPNRLPLAALLSADHRTFLGGHFGEENSGRQYLYAWGLAYYLTFERGSLGTAALDRYVAKLQGNGAVGRPPWNEVGGSPGNENDAAHGPVRRFERLVGTSLPEFEEAWREYILKLDAG